MGQVPTQRSMVALSSFRNSSARPSFGGILRNRGIRRALDVAMVHPGLHAAVRLALNAFLQNHGNKHSLTGASAELLSSFEQQDTELEASAKGATTVPGPSDNAGAVEVVKGAQPEMTDEWRTDGHELVRVCVTRQFNGDDWTDGLVTRWAPEAAEDEPALWHVSFFDGDSEDLDEDEVQQASMAFKKKHVAKKVGADPSEPMMQADMKPKALLDCKDDNGTWARAVVTHVSKDLSIRVHYEGFRRSYDEWLSAEECAERVSARGSHTSRNKRKKPNAVETSAMSGAACNKLETEQLTWSEPNMPSVKKEPKAAEEKAPKAAEAKAPKEAKEKAPKAIKVSEKKRNIKAKETVQQPNDNDDSSSSSDFDDFKKEPKAAEEKAPKAAEEKAPKEAKEKAPKATKVSEKKENIKAKETVQQPNDNDDSSSSSDFDDLKQIKNQIKKETQDIQRSKPAPKPAVKHESSEHDAGSSDEDDEDSDASCEEQVAKPKKPLAKRVARTKSTRYEVGTSVIVIKVGATHRQRGTVLSMQNGFHKVDLTGGLIKNFRAAELSAVGAQQDQLGSTQPKATICSKARSSNAKSAEELKSRKVETKQKASSKPKVETKPKVSGKEAEARRLPAVAFNLVPYLSMEGAVKDVDSMQVLMGRAAQISGSRMLQVVRRTYDICILRVFVKHSGLELIKGQVTQAAAHGDSKATEVLLELLQRMPVDMEVLKKSKICKCVRKIGQMAHLDEMIAVRASFLEQQYSKGLVDEHGNYREVVAGKLRNASSQPSDAADVTKPTVSITSARSKPVVVDVDDEGAKRQPEGSQVTGSERPIEMRAPRHAKPSVMPKIREVPSRAPDSVWELDGLGGGSLLDAVLKPTHNDSPAPVDPDQAFGSPGLPLAPPKTQNIGEFEQQWKETLHRQNEFPDYVEACGDEASKYDAQTEELGSRKRRVEGGQRSRDASHKKSMYRSRWDREKAVDGRDQEMTSPKLKQSRAWYTPAALELDIMLDTVVSITAESKAQAMRCSRVPECKQLASNATGPSEVLLESLRSPSSSPDGQDDTLPTFPTHSLANDRTFHFGRSRQVFDDDIDIPEVEMVDVFSDDDDLVSEPAPPPPEPAERLSEAPAAAVAPPQPPLAVIPQPPLAALSLPGTTGLQPPAPPHSRFSQLPHTVPVAALAHPQPSLGTQPPQVTMQLLPPPPPPMPQMQPAAQHIMPLAEPPLPPGWGQAVDHTGAQYYIDHNTKTTTFHRPLSVISPRVLSPPVYNPHLRHAQYQQPQLHSAPTFPSYR